MRWRSDMYTIYMHTCPNGKIYIGQTKRRCEDRWGNGLHYKNNPHFYNAIKKYGWENIKHEILATTENREEAGELEKKYIALYDATNREKGYNHSTGGMSSSEGYHHTDEAKRKIGEASKGRRLSEYAIKQKRLARIRSVKVYDTQLNLLTICESLTEAEKYTGVDNANIAAVCRGKYKQFKGYIFQYADDDKPIKKPKRGKVVNMYSLDGTLIKQWKSGKQAGRELGVADTHIYDCCNGKISSYKNYIWKYA